MWVSKEEEMILLNSEDKKKQPFKWCVHLRHFGNPSHILHHNVGRIVSGCCVFLQKWVGREGWEWALKKVLPTDGRFLYCSTQNQVVGLEEDAKEIQQLQGHLPLKEPNLGGGGPMSHHPLLLLRFQPSWSLHYLAEQSLWSVVADQLSKTLKKVISVLF